jgi:membrane protein DedA with SNARE-associated domain
MGADHITQLVLEYRYWILIPLTFLEGPIVAFVAGTLAAAGYFNVWFLAVLFFVRDVGLDGVYYGIGYYGHGTKLVQKLLAKIGVTEDHLDSVRKLWERHPGKTMFIGKLSYGIASSFVVVAGAVHMPLRKFFGWGAIVAIIQYGGLLALGYYFGQALGGSIEKILTNVQYLIGGLALVISAYYIITHFIRRRALKHEQEGADSL